MSTLMLSSGRLIFLIIFAAVPNISISSNATSSTSSSFSTTIPIDLEMFNASSIECINLGFAIISGVIIPGNIGLYRTGIM
jgi:hypothetical protein